MAYNGVITIDVQISTDSLQKDISKLDKMLSGITSFNVLSGCIESVTDAMSLFSGGFPVLNKAVQGFSVAAKAFSAVDNIIENFGALNAAVNKAKIIVAENSDLLKKGTLVHKLFSDVLNNETLAENVQLAAKAAGMTIDANNNLITAAGTAATTRETLAVLASSGAISGKTIAVTLLTLGVSAVTMAQNAWNSAMKANPIGAVLVLIGAAVAGVVALTAVLAKSSAEYKKQAEEVSALVEEQEAFVEATKSSEKSHEDNMKSLDVESASTEKLVEQITALSEIENKSAEEKKKLATYVEMLNQQQEGLNLSYQSESDLLSMNAEQISAYTDAKMTIADSNALMERQLELYAEEAELKKNMSALSAKEEELEYLKNNSQSLLEYNGLLKDVSEQKELYAKQAEELLESQKEIDAELMSLDIETAQATIANTEAVRAAKENEAAAEADELNRRKEALQSYSDAATEMFDKINTESKLSVGDMIANMQHNQKALEDWSNNLVVLADKGLDKGLIQKLRDAGPDSAATVAALVKASDKEFSKFNDVFKDGSSVAMEALLKELGLPEVVNSGSDMVDDVSKGVKNNKTLEESTIELIQNAKDAADRKVEECNFASVGSQMINGIIAGINGGSSSLIAAMANAAASAFEAAKSRLQIRSPSRLFEQAIGLMMMKGWASGAKKGEPELIGQIEHSADAAGVSAKNAISFNAHAAAAVARMQQAVAGSSLRLAYSGGSPVLANSASGFGTSITQYFEQNIHSREALSPAEMTREAIAAQAQMKWRLP